MAESDTPREDERDVAPDTSAPATGETLTVSVRRSPKYATFLLLGAALGVIVALILTVTFNGSQQATEAGYTYSLGQVFGFLTLLFVPVGLVIGGVVALILDRAAARRARELTVAREHFRDDG